MGSLLNFQGALQNVIEARGLGISIVGMMITFAALATISVSIAAVPHLLVVLNKYFPEKVEVPKAKNTAVGVSVDIIAAIGLAYHSLQSAKK